jgi:dCMP deaminase
MTLTKQQRRDTLYLDIAERCAQESYAIRKKVGAVVVKDENIISHGWNGTPSGDDNTCEELVYPDDYDGRADGSGPPEMVLRTKPTVLHAELNALMKLARNTSAGTDGATLYVTMSPCVECAKLIKQAGITRVVYRELYRDASGIEFLVTRGISVEKAP